MRLGKGIKLLPLILLLTLLSPLSCNAGNDALGEPWPEEMDETDLTILESTQNEAKGTQAFASTGCVVLKWWVRFYQKIISPVEGDRCPLYPSCSEYSLQALRKHGAIIGFIMTADRLMHEPEEKSCSAVILKFTHLYFYDPVEHNDFWWYNKKKKMVDK